MSNIDLASSRPVPNSGASPYGWLTDLALGAVRWFAFAQERHSGRTRLYNMDDYMLRDIGLQKDQIDDALRGSAGRPWDLIQRTGC